MLSSGKVRQVTVTALLLAGALIVGQVERLMPTPVPGVKLGFANGFSLLALIWWGPKSSVTLTAYRVMILGLINGFGPFFACSAAGAIASQFVTVALWMLTAQKVPLVPLSILGALAHSLAQLVVASYFLGRALVLTYGPMMLFLSALAGLGVGLVTALVAQAVKKTGLHF